MACNNDPLTHRIFSTMKLSLAKEFTNYLHIQLKSHPVGGNYYSCVAFTFVLTETEFTQTVSDIAFH